LPCHDFDSTDENPGFKWQQALAIALSGLAAAAQTTIFDENFDGGYAGVFARPHIRVRAARRLVTNA